ncbi:serine protease, partial [Ascosphaera pollenicola]
MNMDIDQPYFQHRLTTSSQKRTRDEADSSDAAPVQKVSDSLEVIKLGQTLTFVHPQRARPLATESNASSTEIPAYQNPMKFLNLHQGTITPLDSPNGIANFSFPSQTHLEKQRRQLSPLSIKPRMDSPEMDHDLDMSGAAPRPAPPPNQAFGPPWGPDYGVQQISTMNDEGDATTNNGNRAGTPVYNHLSMTEHVETAIHSVQPRRSLEEHRKRLPSPISESEISPTTRIFQEQGDAVQWPSDVPLHSFTPGFQHHYQINDGGQQLQEDGNEHSYALSMGYRPD